ncbi:hypothetical protein, partial [Bifidobacterium pullorum]|uniref:hypothetical protein n=1 Tax=Bifidobacterium pullorum TaxID=78448 RepID=UPI00195CC952
AQWGTFANVIRSRADRTTGEQIMRPAKFLGEFASGMVKDAGTAVATAVPQVVAGLSSLAGVPRLPAEMLPAAAEPAARAIAIGDTANQ